MQTLQQCCPALSSSCHSLIPEDAKTGESHSLFLFLLNDIVIFYIFNNKTILLLNFLKYWIMLTNIHFLFVFLHCLNTCRCLSFNKLLKKLRGRLEKNDTLLWVCFYFFLCDSNSYYINQKVPWILILLGVLNYPVYLTSQWCASQGNMDQFRLLGSCTPTPPLSEHYFSPRARCGLRGEVARWTVSQKPKLIRNYDAISDLQLTGCRKWQFNIIHISVNFLCNTFTL